MAQQKPGTLQLPPPDELYTTLLIVAAVMLLLGIIFIGVRSYQFFDSL